MTADASPAARRNRRIWRRIARTAALMTLVGGGLVASGYLGAEHLLRVESPPRSADLIIVLGGESRHRPRVAAGLHAEGVAPRILITGRGDCHDNEATLIQSNVPPDSILLECASASTRENAGFSRAILERDGIRSAILVTDWFHTRRALRTFQHEVPSVQFYAAPVDPEPGERHHPISRRLRLVMLEYGKLAWYWVVHGIRPW